MPLRALVPLALLAISAAAFVFVLDRLATGADLVAAFGLAAATLSLGALRRSIELLERS